MRGWLIFWLGASGLFAADEERLALVRKAQEAFARVEQAAAPQLADASACVQAQAAMLAVALPQELTQLNYRKGYCELAAASVLRNPAEFTEAAADLEKGGGAALAWLARLQVGVVGQLPGLSSLAAARSGTCPACAALYDTGRLWLGRSALQRGDLGEAARNFVGLTETGWPQWAAGLQAFHEAKYRDAAAQYRQAVEIWTRARRDPAPTLAARLAPPVDLAAALTELGGAQLLTGDLAAAIASFSAALETGPPQTRAFYLRARAKELSGQTDASLADYNLASRVAFANALDLASGEAHLYRGILYYRRKDFARAEDEFSSALNLSIPAALRPDAEAWRHLAAVAGGSCGASRALLERSLAVVSPFFPKDEAKAVAAGCGSIPAGV